MATDKKISELTNYTPPLDADVIPIVDVLNSITKKLTWANIKATLKTYFDTLYLSENQTITLNGDVSGSGKTGISVTIGAGKVTEAMQVLADNTTQDVSTAKHGYVPKAPNDTTKFLRGDGSWAVPATQAASVGLIPTPAFLSFAIGSFQSNVNTTGFFGKILIPAPITIQKLTLDIAGHATNGTIKVALFSEDGQTQYFSVTSPSITGTGKVTITIPSTLLSPGYYYIGVVGVGTVDTSPRCFNQTANGAALNDPTSEPVFSGTLTVTAGTMPATITPTALTISTSACLMCRFDN